MSVDPAALGCLAYAAGFSVWIYNCADEPRATLMDANYFTAAADTVASGDLVICNAQDGAAILRLAHAGDAIVASEMVRSA